MALRAGDIPEGNDDPQGLSFLVPSLLAPRRSALPPGAEDSEGRCPALSEATTAEFSSGVIDGGQVDHRCPVTGA